MIPMKCNPHYSVSRLHGMESGHSSEVVKEWANAVGDGSVFILDRGITLSVYCGCKVPSDKHINYNTG